MNRWLTVLVLLTALALTGCGDDESSDGDDAPTSDAPSVSFDDVLTCLADEGLDVEDVSADTSDGDDPTIAVKYSFDTTRVEFQESAEEATEKDDALAGFDFDDFTVGSVYVILGNLDDDALADRPVIEGCLS